MMTPDDEARHVLDQADCLHDARAVQDAYDRLADAIVRDYAELNPLLLCVMTGGLVPTGEIIKRLGFSCELDYLTPLATAVRPPAAGWSGGASRMLAASRAGTSW